MGTDLAAQPAQHCHPLKSIFDLQLTRTADNNRRTVNTLASLHADSEIRLKQSSCSITDDVSRSHDDVRQVPVHDVVRIALGPNDTVQP